MSSYHGDVCSHQPPPAPSAPAAYATPIPPIRSVAFLHLDLGIGGAEQLMVQLATVTKRLFVATDGNPAVTVMTTTTVPVSIYTTRCDPSHCFAAVGPGGELHDSVRVYGQWIPEALFGRLRVVCSTLRLLYLALLLILRVACKLEDAPSVVVVDVLPAPLWLLQWCLPHSSLLFYCHFPDALLKQQQQQQSSRLQSYYRSKMFQLEQSCMLCADRILVNSLFTQHVVRKTFHRLSTVVLPVLYPALDCTARSSTAASTTTMTTNQTKHYRIVSLNRYERKKNIGLILEAVAWIRDHHDVKTMKLPDIFICGGYDTKCAENVEHRAELEQLAEQLQLRQLTTFRQSISDAERQDLLETSLAVVYTPDQEHFGIVPLEAMQSGTPVIAVNSGGPKETILDGVTGFLCDNSAASFGRAILKLLQDYPELTYQMGAAGRDHVEATFGMDRMMEEWAILLQETHVLGIHRRRSRRYQLARGLVHVVEAALLLLVVWLLTLLLRAVAVLEPDQSVWGKIVRGGNKDEL